MELQSDHPLIKVQVLCQGVENGLTEYSVVIFTEYSVSTLQSAHHNLVVSVICHSKEYSLSLSLRAAQLLLRKKYTIEDI